MLGEAGLELSLLFGQCAIFLSFDLVTCLCCLLVSPDVNMALWSQETQHLVFEIASLMYSWRCPFLTKKSSNLWRR